MEISTVFISISGGIVNFSSGIETRSSIFVATVVILENPEPDIFFRTIPFHVQVLIPVYCVSQTTHGFPITLSISTFLPPASIFLFSTEFTSRFIMTHSYPSSAIILSTAIPKCNPIESSFSTNSVNDLRPKFLYFSI